MELASTLSTVAPMKNFPLRRQHQHFLPSASAPLLPSLKNCKFNLRRCSYYEKKLKYKVSCSQVKLGDRLDDEACELVNGVDLILGEGTDSTHAHLFKAVKNNNGTGVLLLSDIYGFEDSSTRDFAYRVACNGYNVLVPDLFKGNPWRKDRPKVDFDQWRSIHTPDQVSKVINTASKWMVDEFIAAGISKKLGIIGFCFGGARLVEKLSRDEEVSFGIGVCFYGARIDPSLASNIKVPVLFVSGDNDPFCPVGILEEMEKSIGRGSRVVVFEGQRHGFAHRPESPEEDEDAEEAFLLMRNWLHDGLVVKKD